MSRMFDATAYDGLESTAELKEAVRYLAKNEHKFIQELTDEGLGYDAIQQEVKNVWLGLLKACGKFKYSDYLTSSKKAVYGVK